MKYLVIQIDCDAITDWDSFHDTFAAIFGFPDYYGRNMDAWNDCMSDLDHAFVLRLDRCATFRARCPDIYAAIIECSSFVNWRAVESGGEPHIFLSFAD